MSKALKSKWMHLASSPYITPIIILSTSPELLMQVPAALLALKRCI